MLNNISLKKQKLKILLPVIGALLPFSAQAETLEWTGCGISKKAYVIEVAKAFEIKKGIHVKITGGGATKGIRASSAGTTDVGGTCRLYLRGVKGGVDKREVNAQFIHVGWDALVAIANPKNTVDNVSTAQLKGIYDGKITNWKDLEGNDKRIALITRDGKYSGVGHMFRELVFGEQEYDFKAKSLKVKSTGPLEKKVAKIKTAFGVDGISSAKKSKVKIIAIDGIKPTKENISSGQYPLYRPLYLTLNKTKATKQAKEFVEFVLSDEGQAIMSQQGTVNLKEGAGLVAKWKAAGRDLL